MNEPTLQQEFVLRRLSESWQFAGRELAGSIWLAILIPVVLLGLVYIIVMYRRDCRTLAWPFAVLLGLLRACVYFILAGVFLLPAWQTWETTQKSSRVALLIDVSPSMVERSDEIPPEGGVPTKLPTRLDKVVDFLTAEQSAFLAKLIEKNPVYVYRFAARLDDEPVLFNKDNPPWQAEQWDRWLRFDFKYWLLNQLDAPAAEILRRHPSMEIEQPGTADWAIRWSQMRTADVTPGEFTDEQRERFLAVRKRLDKRLEAVRQMRLGTDVGESVLQALNREGGNLLQGIVVVTDGRSTLGAESTLQEAHARAAKDRIPIFAIQVGEDRAPIEIRITDVQTPEQTPPNEKFVVRAELEGVGLAGQEVNVSLDIFAPKATEPTHTLEKKATFQPGVPPQTQVEFALDPDPAADLPEVLRTADKKELVEGEWKFVVRVPREKREVFAGKEHISAPVAVQVIKKPLRVLLVASGPAHDYQFLRTLLVREADQKRAEVSIFLQNEGRDGRAVQDVEGDRMLSRFPTTLRVEDDPEEKPEDRYYNLARYDVVIAYDPDWSEFTAEQLDLLKRWVDNQAGGLIVVAGPVNTFQLARGEEGGRLKPLLDLFPVIPGDSVLVSGATRRPTRTPWRLNFAGASPDHDFLKLDEDAKDAVAGWREFFDGQDAKAESTPRRGFYSTYPVKSVKPGAAVVATFTDPLARLADGKEAPFLVTMPYGKGRVVFLGSNEMRRLRQFREVFYERFWLKLARWSAAGGRTRQNRRGVIVMGREFPAGGNVRVEAQLFGPTLEPLPRTTRSKIVVTAMDGGEKREVEMIAKSGSGDWAGWFQARFPTGKPGEYALELPIPNSGDVLRTKFAVKATDPELDNPRPDPAALYQLASDYKDIEDRLPDAQKRDAVRAQMVRTSGDAPTSSDAARLVFMLNQADVVPSCMTTQRKEQRNRGAVNDIWDDGPVLGTTSEGRPIEISTVLLIVVGLLSAEWLGRKLLRLA
jgi:hypothetical protein